MKRKISLIATALVLFVSMNLISQQEDSNNVRSTKGDAEVGTLPGNFAVSPYGAANYSVPIALPAGRGGMTPSLSLNYNSQRVMG